MNQNSVKFERFYLSLLCHLVVGTKRFKFIFFELISNSLIRVSASCLSR